VFTDFEKDALVPRQYYFNTLRGNDISDEDYKLSETLVKNLNLSSFKDYVDAYLMADVLHLAQVINHFREMCLSKFNLDILYYITLASFSLDLLLKTTNVELELIQDPDQLLFFENSIIGGLSGANHRFSLSNCFEENEEKKQNIKDEPLISLVEYDANSLYGTSLSFNLPYGGFKWLDNQSLDRLKDGINNDNLMEEWDINSPVGFMIEVDINIPPICHQMLDDYPPFPMSRIVKSSELSPYQQNDSQSIKDSHKKLFSCYNEKKRYIIHYIAFKSYFSILKAKGAKIENIYRGLCFNQKPYISKF
jgi:hypothetical protein